MQNQRKAPEASTRGSLLGLGLKGTIGGFKRLLLLNYEGAPCHGKPLGRPGRAAKVWNALKDKKLGFFLKSLRKLENV